LADLVVRPRLQVTFPLREKELVALSYGIIVTGLAVAVFLLSRSGILGQDFPPFIVMLLPVSAYLVLSGLALLAATLLSRSLRWTASGHLIVSLVGVFVAALALINTPAGLKTPLLIILVSALAGGRTP
jgi:hypothetical protein